MDLRAVLGPLKVVMFREGTDLDLEVRRPGAYSSLCQNMTL